MAGDVVYGSEQLELNGPTMTAGDGITNDGDEAKEYPGEFTIIPVINED